LLWLSFVMSSLKYKPMKCEPAPAAWQCILSLRSYDFQTQHTYTRPSHQQRCLLAKRAQWMRQIMIALAKDVLLTQR
jgi:hypothetical protein